MAFYSILPLWFWNESRFLYIILIENKLVNFSCHFVQFSDFKSNFHDSSLTLQKITYSDNENPDMLWRVPYLPMSVVCSVRTRHSRACKNDPFGNLLYTASGLGLAVYTVPMSARWAVTVHREGYHTRASHQGVTQNPTADTLQMRQWLSSPVKLSQIIGFKDYKKEAKAAKRQFLTNLWGSMTHCANSHYPLGNHHANHF